ncbi:MAG: hypothetical protein ABSE15_05035 [Candidatus Bathyarchaeia archaeon]
MSKKIFTDDPRVKYVTTSIAPERTREEISEKLRAYDTYDIYWHWRPEQNDVYVQFIIEEVIDGVPAKVGAKVVMPIIWDKAVPRSPDPKRRVEQVNLKVSMRALFWYIKANLENAYAMQSSRVAAFLPDTIQPNGKRFFDNLKARLDQFQALPDVPREKPVDVEVVVPTEDQRKRERVNVTNGYPEDHVKEAP